MTITARPLPTCGWDHCSGHLGKFQSCRDEALYELTLDGFYDSTGDVEFEGHLTLVVLDEPTEVAIYGHETPITVEPGAYLVEVTNTGAVYVGEGDPASLASELLAADERYGRWLDADEEDS